MTYSDFEDILSNRGSMAKFFCDEYNGTRHIVIQDWTDVIIMICINKEETEIRVSFPYEQKYFTNYEEALDYIQFFY